MEPVIGGFVREPASRREPGPVATVVGILGLVLTVAALWISLSADRSARDEAVVAAGEDATHRVFELTEAASDRLVAVGGLFRASEVVSAVEFRRFVEDLGRSPGIIGVGYAAVVPESEMADFLEFARAQHGRFVPYGMDEDQNPLPLTDRRSYQLTLYAEPADSFGGMVGFDLGSLPLTRDAVAQAGSRRSVAATPPFAPSGGFDGDEFVVIEPVAGDEKRLAGFALALMDMEALLADGMPGHEPESGAVVVGDATATAASPDAAWTTTLPVFGRTWRIELVGYDEVGLVSTSRILIALVGLVASLGASVLADTFAQNRRHRAESERYALAAQQTDRLLAMVSHELRTPMTAIIGFLEELRHRPGDLSEGEKAGMLDDAAVAAQEVADLVSDLLVRERMLSGVGLAIAPSAVDVVGEVRAVADRIVPTGTVISGEECLHVEADPLRLRQIVRNLLDNAVTHGAPPVQVVVDSLEDECCVTVTDGGPGVAECCRPSLFTLGADPEEHGHPRPIRSNGFGLPISLYLAHSMGGDLVYEPAANCFQLRLRLVAEPGLRAASARDESEAA